MTFDARETATQRGHISAAIDIKGISAKNATSTETKGRNKRPKQKAPQREAEKLENGMLGKERK